MAGGLSAARMRRYPRGCTGVLRRGQGSGRVAIGCQTRRLGRLGRARGVAAPLSGVGCAGAAAPVLARLADLRVLSAVGRPGPVCDARAAFCGASRRHVPPVAVGHHLVHDVLAGPPIGRGSLNLGCFGGVARFRRPRRTGRRSAVLFGLHEIIKQIRRFGSKHYGPVSHYGFRRSKRAGSKYLCKLNPQGSVINPRDHANF